MDTLELLLRASGVTDEDINKINNCLNPQEIEELKKYIEERQRRRDAMQSLFQLTGMIPGDDSWG